MLSLLLKKKLLSNITSVFKRVVGGSDCVFVVDNSFSIFVDKTAHVKKQETVLEEEKVSILEYDLSFFDDLFVGSCNNLAVTAAKNVVVSPGDRFNPLFIYGGVGLGKTHLMHAVGNEILQNEPKKKNSLCSF